MNCLDHRSPRPGSAGPLAILILVTGGILLAVPAAAQEPGAGRRCGEYCVRVALTGLGFDAAAVEAAAERLGVAPSGGHAAADLLAAVEAAGGHAAAVRTDLQTLQARRAAGDRFACVAHVDGNHYLLISSIGDRGGVEVIDPPRFYTIPPETLDERWDGTAVLISAVPLTPSAELQGSWWRWASALAVTAAFAVGVVLLLTRRRAAAALVALALPAAGCGAADEAPPDAAPAGRSRIEFTRYEHDAGFVSLEQGLFTATFPLRNTGNGELRVGDLKPGCGCAVAVIDRSAVPPGETAIIRAEVRLTGPEERRTTVTVPSNDPHAPNTLLRLAWKAVAPLSPEPPAIDFGAVRPGEAVERTVRLIRYADGDDLGAAGSGEMNELTEVAGAVATPHKVFDSRFEPGVGGPAVNVRLTAPDVSGRGSGTVTIRLRNGWTDAIYVPVRYEVRDVLSASPPKVFLAVGEPGEAVEARVTIVGEGPLTLAEPPRVEAAGGWAPTASVEAGGSGRARVIRLSGTLPDTPGRVEATLVVTADVVAADDSAATERRTLRVPISAYVPDPAGAAR